MKALGRRAQAGMEERAALPDLTWAGATVGTGEIWRGVGEVVGGTCTEAFQGVAHRVRPGLEPQLNSFQLCDLGPATSLSKAFFPPLQRNNYVPHLQWRFTKKIMKLQVQGLLSRLWA